MTEKSVYEGSPGLKLADYVIDYLADLGIKHVFVVYCASARALLLEKAVLYA